MLDSNPFLFINAAAHKASIKVLRPSSQYHPNLVAVNRFPDATSFMASFYNFFYQQHFLEIILIRSIIIYTSNIEICKSMEEYCCQLSASRCPIRIQVIRIKWRGLCILCATECHVFQPLRGS